MTASLASVVGVTDSVLEATASEDHRDGSFAGHEVSWRERVVQRALQPSIDQAMERAELLVRAARKMIEQSGDTVTVQEIADEAGMSLRLLYRHFKSKDDLVGAVLEESQMYGTDSLEKALGHLPDAHARVREFVRLVVDIDLSPMHSALARHESHLLQSDTAEARRVQRPMSGLAVGLLRDLDPGVGSGAAYLVLAGKRAYNWNRLLGNTVGIDHVSPEVFSEFLLAGLGEAPTA